MKERKLCLRTFVRHSCPILAQEHPPHLLTLATYKRVDEYKINKDQLVTLL